MKHIASYMLIIMIALTTAQGADQFAALYGKAQAVSDTPQKGEVLLAKGHKLKYSLEVTSKGNGTIQIGGILIRSYDVHDDGVLYDGGALNHQLTDVDFDGDLDLIVSGIAAITTDEGVTRRKAVLAVFLYDQATRSLKQSVKSEYIFTSKKSDEVSKLLNNYINQQKNKEPLSLREAIIRSCGVNFSTNINIGSEQDGAGQPATRSEPKSKGSINLQPDSEGRSR